MVAEEATTDEHRPEVVRFSVPRWVGTGVCSGLSLVVRPDAHALADTQGLCHPDPGALWYADVAAFPSGCTDAQATGNALADKNGRADQ